MEGAKTVENIIKTRHGRIWEDRASVSGNSAIFEDLRARGRNGLDENNICDIRY